MKKSEEREMITFQGLKDILFRDAAGEMKGYLHAREKMNEDMAEIQRQRYVALYQVIDNANLNEEYEDYKMRL